MLNITLSNARFNTIYLCQLLKFNPGPRACCIAIRNAAVMPSGIAIDELSIRETVFWTVVADELKQRVVV